MCRSLNPSLALPAADGDKQVLATPWRGNSSPSSLGRNPLRQVVEIIALAAGEVCPHQFLEGGVDVQDPGVLVQQEHRGPGKEEALCWGLEAMDLAAAAANIAGAVIYTSHAGGLRRSRAVRGTHLANTFWSWTQGGSQPDLPLVSRTTPIPNLSSGDVSEHSL